MSKIVEFEDKAPAATDFILRCMHQVIDALQRNNFSEATKYTGDALAKVQNEIDWCYRTDRVLPFWVDFLVSLGDSITTAQEVTLSYRREQVLAIINVIQETSGEMERATTGVTREEAPDRYIDSIEAADRANTYGKTNS